ncbi:MAG: NUDIX domain-containing protein [Frankiaceae bacterium]
MIQAAGGVLWRGAGRTGDDVEIALIHRPRYDDWSLPKGKQDPTEHVTVTARREVEEETGYRAPLGKPLLSQQYTFWREGQAMTKSVRYWAMRAPDAPEAPFTANAEVDELRWLPPSEADELLTHERDKATLKSLFTTVPRTSTTLLIRHGKAGEKKTWKRPDIERPLDSTGRAQAQAVRRAAACFEPGLIVSADPTRCAQTVQPLADDLGLKVVLDRSFSVAGYSVRPNRTLRRFRNLMTSGTNVAVCSQGEVIPGLMTSLAKSAGLQIDSADTPKGGMWALSIAKKKLVATEFFSDLTPPAAPADARGGDGEHSA